MPILGHGSRFGVGVPLQPQGQEIFLVSAICVSLLFPLGDLSLACSGLFCFDDLSSNPATTVRIAGPMRISGPMQHSAVVSSFCSVGSSGVGLALCRSPQFAGLGSAFGCSCDFGVVVAPLSALVSMLDLLCMTYVG